MADNKEKLSPAAERRVAALGDSPEAELERERLSAEEEAANHEMETPDGDKGHPIPGELGYRAEFWQDKLQPLKPL